MHSCMRTVAGDFGDQGLFQSKGLSQLVNQSLRAARAELMKQHKFKRLSKISEAGITHT